MACTNADASLAALLAALAGPKRVAGDAGEVEQYSLKDLMEVHRYLAAQCAATNGRRGLRFTRLVPEGATNLDVSDDSRTDGSFHVA